MFNIEVNEDMRGKGIEKQALILLEGFARLLQVNEISLNVFAFRWLKSLKSLPH